MITAGEKYSPANNVGTTVPTPPTIVSEQQQPFENGEQTPMLMVSTEKKN